MKVTRCKLSKKAQLWLLEFFTAEATAQTADELLNIQLNAVYYKVRLIITIYWSISRSSDASTHTKLAL